jgi:hypothetical protein
METFWAASREEIEEIVDKIISNYSYDNSPISLQSAINIYKRTAGTLVGTVGVELTNENPSVTIQPREAMEEGAEFTAVASGMGRSLFPWGYVADLHEIVHLPWGKETSAGARTLSSSFLSPVNVPTTYTYMTYNELLRDYQNLRSENSYFRKQLAAIYTPKKLQKYSVFYGFFSVFCLGLSKILNINLIHPILAYFVFAISAFFYLIGILMEEREK